MTIHASKKRKLSPLSHSSSSDTQEVHDNALSTLSKIIEVDKNGSESVALISKPQVTSLNGPKVPRRSRTQDFTAIDASQSYGKSFLQMQVDQIVADVSSRHESFYARVDPFLKRLEQIIDGIPPQGPKSASETREFLRQTYAKAIHLPQNGPEIDAKYRFSYDKPARLCTIDGRTSQTCLKSAGPRTVDLIVVMPSTIFQVKDYKHFRYFHKRAFYLACIVSAIRKERDLGLQINFSYENDCLLQPILLLTPLGFFNIRPSRCVEWQLRILTAVDENVFPARELLPWKNCLQSASEVSVRSEVQLKAVSCYYSALRTECSRILYEKLLGDTCKRCSGYRDACKLGSLWLQQRGLKTSFRGSGFGPFEFAATMALLLSSGGSSGRPFLSAGYNSFQLFQGVLRYLLMRDLIKNPVSIGGNVDFPSQSLAKTPMLYDATRGLNILYKMSPWSYQSLIIEAQTTGKALNDPIAKGQLLEGVFLSKVDQPMLRFDMVLRIKVPISWFPDSSDSAFIDRTLSFASKLYEVLSEGLNDRATLINLQQPDLTAQQTGLAHSDPEADSVIMIQLLLDPEQSNRMIDRGPLVEEKQAAAAFRRFWGEKAELRRYKDGSILESLVWSQGPIKDSICEQIIKHVVRRHLGEQAMQNLACIANDFHRPLHNHEHQVHQSVSLYRSAFATYESLEKKLHDCEGLPLQVRRIVTSCEHLRYTSLMTSEELVSQSSNAPLDIVVQFEGSSRWPDSLPAIQRTKIAFLLKIGELLELSTPGLLIRLGLENTTKQPNYNLPFLDIKFPELQHQVFRLRIHHEQERSLLESQMKGKTASQSCRTLAAAGTAIHKQSFLSGPIHTQVVASFCRRHHLLSPSIRLLKRWCATHLLSATLLPPEVLELLTIQCFVSPFPWSQPPASIRTGFLRTLSLIARWDWPREPIIINVNGEMKQDEKDAIQQRFEAWRKLDPGMNRVTFFIASTMDTSGVAWTERAIEKVVAWRLQSLAKAACQIVNNSGINVEVSSLFTHNYSDYDFLVHLDAVRLKRWPGRATKPHSRFTNLQARPDRQEPLSIGFGPLDLFVKELGLIYGDSLLLFHNPLKPDVVGGLWYPSTSMKRPWKVELGYSTKPSSRVKDVLNDGEVDVVGVGLNKWGILREIKSLGGDLVKSIEILENEQLL